MSYKIKLDIFEGPLDLLLHLIKKNEVDIYDIPISVITEQYLEYIELMKEMNLNLAGEFLVMAATLVHIKSRMLLPVPELEGEEEEGVDPREELIERLLEYQKYKEASEMLASRTMLGRDVFARAPEPVAETPGEQPPLDVSIFALVEALKDILERSPEENVLEVSADRFTVADKINSVLETLAASGGTATFEALFERGAPRGEIIVTFLAVLELVKLLLIKVHQTEDGIIRVYSAEPDDVNSAAASAGDEAEGPVEGTEGEEGSGTMEEDMEKEA